MDLGAQLGLFGRGDVPRFDPTLAGAERLDLGEGAWVDRVPRWIDEGQDGLFRALAEGVPWKTEARRMYDQTVLTPRLYAFDDEGAAPPHPTVVEMGNALSQYYRVPLVHRSYALYRDGQDSVAYHRDRELRDRNDSLVAIVTLGGPRTFRLRPFDADRRRREGSVGFRVGDGDLLVMGGACQRDWEHGVPKAARAAPRLAVMFRHGLDGTAARGNDRTNGRIATPSP